MGRRRRLQRPSLATASSFTDQLLCPIRRCFIPNTALMTRTNIKNTRKRILKTRLSFMMITLMRRIMLEFTCILERSGEMTGETIGYVS